MSNDPAQMARVGPSYDGESAASQRWLSAVQPSEMPSCNRSTFKSRPNLYLHLFDAKMYQINVGNFASLARFHTAGGVV